MTNPKMTLAHWCHVWIASRSAEPSRLTVRMNQFHLRTRILPYLGSYALTDLTWELIARHAARRIGLGVAVASVAAEMRLLAAALAAAVDAGHIPASPAITVHTPAPEPVGGAR